MVQRTQMPRFKAQPCTFSNSWLSRVENFLGILRKPQINYFSETSLDGYFMLTSDISAKSVPQQGWKIRRANHSAEHWKSDFFFCIISTALTETGGGVAIAFFYRKTLQVCLWKIRIQITCSCACIVLVLF